MVISSLMTTLQIISVLDFLKPLNLNSSGPHIVSNFNLDISLFKIISQLPWYGHRKSGQ